MNKVRCWICGHAHDERRDDPDWMRCPVCGFDPRDKPEVPAQ